MQYWSLVAIIISLVVVIVLALKGVKIILIAPVAAVAVAMLSNVNGLGRIYHYLYAVFRQLYYQ